MSSSAHFVCASAVLFLCGFEGAAAATVYEGIAEIESTTLPDVSGSVHFSQDFGSPCVHVSATINGLTDGLHGFHVHQYGDLTSDYDKSSLGAHFTPICTDSRRQLQYETPPEGADSVGTQCYNDSVHGMPPSNVRQSGDMGNIESSGGVATFDMDLCQEKMSLYDPIKSILGRAVVVHESEDTGAPPFGLAGDPIAAGIVGRYNTDASGDENAASPPTNPLVERVMCYMRGEFDGPALLEKKFMTAEASISARIVPAVAPTEDVMHSFHFHKFGELADVGDIWQYSKVNVTELPVPAGATTVYFCETFAVTNDLSDFVGRILTIHSGPTSSSPTVASGVCGLANPDAVVPCSAEDEENVDGANGLTTVSAALAVSALAAACA